MLHSLSTLICEFTYEDGCRISQCHVEEVIVALDLSGTLVLINAIDPKPNRVFLSKATASMPSFLFALGHSQCPTLSSMVHRELVGYLVTTVGGKVIKELEPCCR